MTAQESAPGVRVREAGDSALLLELGVAPPFRQEIDDDVNAGAIRIGHAIRERRIPGVRDVVSTFRSVAVFFDPLATDAATLAAMLPEHLNDAPSEDAGRLVEVPVAYGGDAGPDLADVAAFARSTPDVVVERHAARTYRVYMLGFLPGFPYMGSVDESIAAPRRSTPRVRVPAGSVGIAGRQTGIYPRDSPGGWQIIGWTPVEMFDAGRVPPALLAPGDSVRFVPVSPDTEVRLTFGSAQVNPEHRRGVKAASDGVSQVRLNAVTTYEGAPRYITVLRPGLQTTIQDEGRWGYQHLGVPVSGAMDLPAHRLANALLGNGADAATIEVALLGPELRFEHSARIAVAGGDLQPMLDESPLSMCTVADCPAGSVLRFGGRRSGARAYVAVDGGIASPPVLGSRSTHVSSGMGGIQGRAVKTGDRIPLSAGTSGIRARARPESRATVTGGARVRILPGPQVEYFDPSALDALQRARYTISPQSDRMGYRLAGGSPDAFRAKGEMISDATVVGAVQVPPSGQPILLMADRQTTGGYPQIAVVITADVPLAAQLAPGDWIQFELCSRADAMAALAGEERRANGGE